MKNFNLFITFNIDLKAESFLKFYFLFSFFFNRSFLRYKTRYFSVTIMKKIFNL